VEGREGGVGMEENGGYLAVGGMEVRYFKLGV
jgi:hypothetical protein